MVSYFKNISTTKDYLILKMSTNIAYGLVVERLSDKPAGVEQKYTKLSILESFYTGQYKRTLVYLA